MGHQNSSLPSPSIILMRVRRFLLWLLGAEIIGVGAELLLISHWEDGWQSTPLIALTLGLVALSGHVIFQNRASLRAIQFIMVLFVLSGVLGVWLHYDGRVEFRLELDPALAGWRLFCAAMMGSTTPPVLAPGIMIQMGCMGLVCVYGQPARVREPASQSASQQ
jgi:hypothetical protein